MKRLWLIMAVMIMIVSCGKSSPTRNVLDFKANDLNGKEMSFAEYRGKVVLLNIWATWCPPCVKEIPDLNEVHHAYKNRDVIVLGVSVDASAEDVRQALKGKIKVDYPVWHADADFIRRFQIRSIPHTMIVNKEGVIVEEMMGIQSRDAFESALRKAMK